MRGPQQRMSWSESISVGSTEADRCRYRRSASVSCLQPGRLDLRRREGVYLALALTPTAFAESVFCYVGDTETSSSSSSSRRHHKSTVKYNGVGLKARRYFETCFVLPTSSVRHLSHFEAHPLADTSRRWYTAALKLVPRHNSVSESPTSPGSADRSSVSDDNNNPAGGNIIRSRHSEQITGDNNSTSFRSRLVVHVQPIEP